MAGHSHWAGIKHKKALVDAKRGKLWGKLSKAIIVAAKLGGGDPDANIRLRTAIEDAKAESMPKDNIARAIKRGTGELEGGNLEELTYEGYGPGGVAVLCEVLTDNRNRTAPEIRKIFEMSGGKLGAAGCVAWMFEKKGLFLFSADKTDEETLMEIALEAGADDVREDGDQFQVTCSVDVFRDVKRAFAESGIEAEVSELSLIPSSTADVDEPATARKVLKLMERLDDHDDVQSVSSNFNIADEIMAEVEAE
jgi:YebC/PmpR family DNA-binding regulatory protein